MPTSQQTNADGLPLTQGERSTYQTTSLEDSISAKFYDTLFATNTFPRRLVEDTINFIMVLKNNFPAEYNFNKIKAFQHPQYRIGSKEYNARFPDLWLGYLSHQLSSPEQQIYENPQNLTPALLKECTINLRNRLMGLAEVILKESQELKKTRADLETSIAYIDSHMTALKNCHDAFKVMVEQDKLDRKNLEMRLFSVGQTGRNHNRIAFLQSDSILAAADRADIKAENFCHEDRFRVRRDDLEEKQQQVVHLKSTLAIKQQREGQMFRQLREKCSKLLTEWELLEFLSDPYYQKFVLVNSGDKKGAYTVVDVSLRTPTSQNVAASAVSNTLTPSYLPLQQCINSSTQQHSGPVSAHSINMEQVSRRLGNLPTPKGCAPEIAKGNGAQDKVIVAISPHMTIDALAEKLKNKTLKKIEERERATISTTSSDTSSHYSPANSDNSLFSLVSDNDEMSASKKSKENNEELINKLNELQQQMSNNRRHTFELHEKIKQLNSSVDAFTQQRAGLETEHALLLSNTESKLKVEFEAQVQAVLLECTQETNKLKQEIICVQAQMAHTNSELAALQARYKKMENERTEPAQPANPAAGGESLEGASSMASPAVLSQFQMFTPENAKSENSRAFRDSPTSKMMESLLLSSKKQRVTILDQTPYNKQRELGKLIKLDITHYSEVKEYLQKIKALESEKKENTEILKKLMSCNERYAIKQKELIEENTTFQNYLEEDEHEIESLKTQNAKHLDELQILRKEIKEMQAGTKGNIACLLPENSAEEVEMTVSRRLSFSA